MNIYWVEERGGRQLGGGGEVIGTAGQRVALLIEASGAVNNGVLMMIYCCRPSNLAAREGSRRREVLKCFVIGDDSERGDSL